LFWNRSLIPYDGDGEFREPKDPDFAFASCAERIGSGNASARELKQIATFDAEKLRRLVGRDKRLEGQENLPRLFGGVTAVGAEKVSALSPVSPPVAASSGMEMIDMFDSLARYVETGVGCRCCEPLGIGSEFEGNESTVKREACRLEDAVFSRAPNWVGRDFMFVRRPSQERLH